MTQTEAIENFEAHLKGMPEGEWKTLCQALIDLFQTKIKTYDFGWENPEFYDNAGNFKEGQALWGLIERGSRKKELLDLITLIDQFIHPEEAKAEDGVMNEEE